MNVRLAHKVVGFVSVLCVQLLGNHPCKIKITDWRRSADYWLKTVEEPELMVGLLRCVLGGCKEQGAYVFFLLVLAVQEKIELVYLFFLEQLDLMCQ